MSVRMLWVTLAVLLVLGVAGQVGSVLLYDAGNVMSATGPGDEMVFRWGNILQQVGAALTQVALFGVVLAIVTEAALWRRARATPRPQPLQQPQQPPPAPSR